MCSWQKLLDKGKLLKYVISVFWPIWSRCCIKLLRAALFLPILPGSMLFVGSWSKRELVAKLSELFSKSLESAYLKQISIAPSTTQAYN